MDNSKKASKINHFYDGKKNPHLGVTPESISRFRKELVKVN